MKTGDLVLIGVLLFGGYYVLKKSGIGEAVEGVSSGVGTAASGLGQGISDISTGTGSIVQSLADYLGILGSVGNSASNLIETAGETKNLQQEAKQDEKIIKTEIRADQQVIRTEIRQEEKTLRTEQRQEALTNIQSLVLKPLDVFSWAVNQASIKANNLKSSNNIITAGAINSIPEAIKPVVYYSTGNTGVTSSLKNVNIQNLAPTSSAQQNLYNAAISSQMSIAPVAVAQKTSKLKTFLQNIF